jgi:hypothetical protein
MKYCCEFFKKSFESRHRTGGPVVFLHRTKFGSDYEYSFYLGFRSIETEAVERLRDVLKGQDVGGVVHLNGSIGLRFCPWCGTELFPFYRKTDFLELVDETVSKDFGHPSSHE